MTPRDPRTPAQWVTLVCSCLILGGLVALIAAQLGETREPAAPVVVLGEVRDVGGTHHVDVVVTNEGDETAANVQVVAELTVDGTVTTGEQMIDFLAGGEEEELVFVFDDDPGEGDLSVSVAGFAVP